MIQSLWELEKHGEEKGIFFLVLYRCGGLGLGQTFGEIWLEQELGCAGGATVAVELKSQDPSLPPTLSPQWGPGGDNLCSSERSRCVRTRKASGGSEALPRGSRLEEQGRAMATLPTCQSQTLCNLYFPICSPQVRNELFLAYRLDIEIVFPT